MKKTAAAIFLLVVLVAGFVSAAPLTRRLEISEAQKEERFKRVAERRVQRVLDDLRKLSQCRMQLCFAIIKKFRDTHSQYINSIFLDKL